MENIVRSISVPMQNNDIIYPDTPQVIQPISTNQQIGNIDQSANINNQSTNVDMNQSTDVDMNQSTNVDISGVQNILKQRGYYPNDKNSTVQKSNSTTGEFHPTDVQRDSDGTPIFQKAAEWVGETAENTIDRAKELAGALGYAFIHPKKAIIDPTIQYTKEKVENNQYGDIPVDILNNFFVHPLAGKSIQDMYKDGYKPEDFGEHIHQGGLVDIALTAPLAGGLLGGSLKTLGKTGKAAIKGTKLDDYLKVQDVKRTLRSEEVFNRAQANQSLRDFKKDLLNKIKEYHIHHNDMTELVKHMRGEEGKNLHNLPSNLQPVWEGLKPVVQRYDQVLNDIKARGNLEFTTEAENLMEIYQHFVHKAGAKGHNFTYQYVKDGLIDSGLLDFGNFVDKATGKVIKEGNILNALSDKPTPTEIPHAPNLRFEIPEENLEMLAQKALDTSNGIEKAGLAKELFNSYGLAESGGLQRISQGLADIDKSALLGKAGRVKKNGLFSDRVYGNASAEDIAWQWLEPENLFQYGVKGILRDAVVQNWKNEFLANGKPILSKYAKPENVRYVRQDTFFNSEKLDKIDRYALKEIPRNVNPEAYIPIDTYTLEAYKQLFSPSWMSKKMPIVKDLIGLYKQTLLASGTYLGPNLLGGLHQVLTHSNINIIQDVSDAIRTRGNLIGQLGALREMPIKGDIKAATNPKTWYGDTIRKINILNQGMGSYHWRSIDAAIQNTFAEINAHSVFRKLGVKFEDRNLKWLQDNITKEQMYKAINDIEKQSLIYGDETLIPKPVLDFMEMGNPFIRWPDQATMSTIDLMEKNPIAFGYLQGAVLGGLVWSQNEANAKGMGISNPQAGKMYHFDKNGEKRVTETEVIPVQSTLRFATTPDYLVNSEKNAIWGWAMDMIKVKDQYGRLKERSKYGDKLLPDYQRKVRYKNGVITDNAEIDEIFANMVKSSVPFRNINLTAGPLIYGAFGKPAYQPYNNQFMIGPGGNPDKPVTPDKVIQRLRGEFEHPIIEGKDDELTSKKQAQLTRTLNKKETKREYQRLQDRGEIEQ